MKATNFPALIQRFFTDRLSTQMEASRPKARALKLSRSKPMERRPRTPSSTTPKPATASLIK